MSPHAAPAPSAGTSSSRGGSASASTSTSSSAPSPNPRPALCVVGSGVSGLVAAHYLSREYRVTLLESADELGMDSASKDFAGGRLDVPLRTFTKCYYENLVRVYDEIGVEYAQPDYSFSCMRRGESRPYFRFMNVLRHWFAWGWLGYEKIGLPGTSVWGWPRILGNVFTLYRFMQDAHRELNDPGNRLASVTFKEWVDSRGYSDAFYREMLMPMLSVVCTCTFDAVGAYPAEVLVDYLAGRADQFPLGRHTQRATSGTRDVVRRLSSGCDRVLTSRRVREIVPAADSSDAAGDSARGRAARVTWTEPSGAVTTEEFAHVVIATQANAALALLGDRASPDLRSALASVRYERNRTVLHTDESILPPRAEDRGAVNLSLSEDATRSDCTVWMNKIDDHMERTLARDVFQTWNPTKEPAKDKIVYEVWFERPVLTLETARALDELARLQGRGNLWFVGAFSLYSMPLLENGTRSAIRVANRLLRDPANRVPELGAQISGEPFARRRPDLVVGRGAAEGSSSRSPSRSWLLTTAVLGASVSVSALAVAVALVGARRSSGRGESESVGDSVVDSVVDSVAAVVDRVAAVSKSAARAVVG